MVRVGVKFRNLQNSISEKMTLRTVTCNYEKLLWCITWKNWELRTCQRGCAVSVIVACAVKWLYGRPL